MSPRCHFMTTARVAALVGLPFLLAACQLATGGDTMVGSGTPATQERNTGSFTSLHVGSAIQAQITIGSPVSVGVTADDNLVDRVNTTVARDTLEVAWVSGSVSTRTPVRVTITVPALSGIDVDSAASVTVDGLDASAFTVRAASAGRVTVTGTAISLDLTGDSGAAADLSALAVQTAQVDLASAATAQVKATGRVSGSVKEAAALILIGKPATVEVSAQTAGTITYR
jgi:Putative auto-transporter adhesin, head GIN domain